MRTSHKRTHTQLPVWLRSICQRNWQRNWLKLMVIALFLGGLTVAVAFRSELWTAKANEMDAVRARLQEAKAQYLASPTKENTANFDKAMAAYKAALKANPASHAAQSQGAVGVQAVNFGVSQRASDIAPLPPSQSAAKLGMSRKNESNEIPFRNYVTTPTKTNDPVVQSAI